MAKPKLSDATKAAIQEGNKIRKELMPKKTSKKEAKDEPQEPVEKPEMISNENETKNNEK